MNVNGKYWFTYKLEQIYVYFLTKVQHTKTFNNKIYIYIYILFYFNSAFIHENPKVRKQQRKI